ncbi:Putative signal transducing protein [Ensifer adhaerens]|nr:Putative signal transducing protein [Ensifer adhaerens]
MEELVRTNDPVLISFLESLMRDAGIVCMVADQTMSILDGSIGAIPRRVLVDGERLDEARAIVKDAGLGAELRDRKPT